MGITVCSRRQKIQKLFKEAKMGESKRGKITAYDINADGYDDNSAVQYKEGKIIIKEAVQSIVQMVKDNGLKRIRVLDAGCGNGRTTINLYIELRKTLVKIADIDINIVGIDISDNMIIMARENTEIEGIRSGRINFYSKNIEDLSEDDGLFDLIFCNFTLHLCTENIYKCFYDRLSEGGTLVINQGGSVSNNTFHQLALSITKEKSFINYFKNWAWPFFYPTKKEAGEYLNKAGFVNISLREEIYKDYNYTKMIETFINASLNVYIEQVEDEELRGMFRQRFRQLSYEAKDKYKQVDRLYIKAKKA